MRHRIPNVLLLSLLSLQNHHWLASVSSLRHVSLARRCTNTQNRPLATSREFHETKGRLYLQHSSGESKSTTSDANTSSTLAEQAFKILAKKKKTWFRLRHLVALAQYVQTHNHNNNTNNESSALPQQQQQQQQQMRSIVDIGTDHGILPIALAATGQFYRVTGVDVSEKALHEGAKTLYQEVQSNLDSLVISTPSSNGGKGRDPLSVEFLLGNGLEAMEPGAADIACIAGMGVHTMLDILDPVEIERVGCQALLLQPTNSKPKNLMTLYDTLQQERGWQLFDEHIEKQSSRWYLSAAFVRRTANRCAQDHNEDEKTLLPGTFLQTLDDKDCDNLRSMKSTFEDYVQHHGSWLESDMKIKGELSKEELRWMEIFMQHEQRR